MNPNYSMMISKSIAILSLVLSGCSGISQTSTATSTATREPTNTPRPSATPKPSPTPDIAATERADQFSSLITSFLDAGYLENTEGEIIHLEPEWKEMEGSRSSYWSYAENLKDFLFSAHYDWDKLDRTPQSLGCNISFGFKYDMDTGENLYYQVYFDDSRIWFDWVDITKTSGRAYALGKTKGDGRVNFGDRTETEFALLVYGQSAYVYRDGETTEYSLPEKWNAEGEIHLSQNSYGGICEMSNITLWTPK